MRFGGVGGGRRRPRRGVKQLCPFSARAHVCPSVYLCSFPNLTHLSAAGEACKLNIQGSLALSLSLSLSLAWVPLLPPTTPTLPCPVNSLSAPWLAPRLYPFFLLSSPSFPSVFSRRDTESVKDGARRRRAGGGVGGDHRGDEAARRGWMDRCIDKGRRLCRFPAAYPIPLFSHHLFFISG